MNVSKKHTNGMSGGLSLGALILFAFALRVFMLGVQDIWWDEGRNIFTASRPLEAIASAPELDIHPPFYFYLLHFWMDIVGAGEFVVRFFSLWFGVALVPVAFRLGTYLKDRTVGWWAAFLVALSPFLVDEAQQARMYTLLLFLATLSMYFLLRVQKSHCWRDGVMYVLTATLSFYTHYSFVYILATQNLFLLLCLVNDWRRHRSTRTPLKRWLVSQLSIGLLYTFQIPNIIRQMGIYGNPGMTPPTLLQYTIEITRAFLLGTKIEMEQMTSAGIWIGMVLLISVIGVWRKRQHWSVDRRLGLIVAWLIVPLALYFIVLFKSPQFTPRYAMVCIVPLYLLLVWAITFSTQRDWRIGAMVAGVWIVSNGIAWQSQFFNPNFFNDDTRGLAQFISENTKADDIVFVDVPYPFFYYYRGMAPAEYLFVDIHTTADMLTQKAQGKKRIFWIQWYKSDTDPRGYVSFLLDKYATLEGKRSFRGYNVSWYQLPKQVSFSLASAPQAVSVIFGEKIKLTSFAYGGALTSQTPDVDVPLVVLSSKMWVVLWWQLIKLVNANYKVSIQIRDAEERLAAQDDRMLINDQHLDTYWWKPNQTVINVYTPELVAGVKPGEYTVYVVVYDAQTGTPLAVDSVTHLFPIGILQIIR